MEPRAARLLTCWIPVKSWRKAARARLKHGPAPLVKALAKLEKLERRMDLLVAGMYDQNGLAHFRLLLEVCNVPDKYRYLFFNIKKGDVCIDCGMHAGKVTDVILFQDGISIGFEPNASLISFLERKYEKKQNATVYHAAVGAKNGKAFFHTTNEIDSEGASLIAYDVDSSSGYEVECVRLSEFIENSVLPKYGSVYLLKLDVEGVEFEILHDIISTEMYKKVRYIVCETHARFFEDGADRLQKLENLIAERKIQNIFLDWI